jgi:transcriptional regulator with XRE-family HTH domain
MGSPDSGRPPSKLSIEDCRALDIGEVCDAGAATAFPAGEILWREKGSRVPLALLAYRVASKRPAGLARRSLLYLYWPSVTGAPHGDEIELAGGERARRLARCPAPGCDQPVRILYAPLGDELFFCRGCHDLVYRRSRRAAELRLAREVLSPLLAEIRAAGEGGGPLIDQEEYNYLGPQESRLACLHLRAHGLSLRQIAARVGVSKSSVQRYLLAGASGIDLLELYRERQLEAYLTRSGSLANGQLGPRAIAEELREIDRDAKRWGLYRHSATENEERVCFRVAACEEVSEPPATLADYGRCFDALREAGQLRLSAELARRPRRRRW